MLRAGLNLRVSRAIMPDHPTEPFLKLQAIDAWAINKKLIYRLARPYEKYDSVLKCGSEKRRVADALKNASAITKVLAPTASPMAPFALHPIETQIASLEEGRSFTGLLLRDAAGNVNLDDREKAYLIIVNIHKEPILKNGEYVVVSLDYATLPKHVENEQLVMAIRRNGGAHLAAARLDSQRKSTDSASSKHSSDDYSTKFIKR